MTWVLLALGVVEALLGLNAHRPVRSPTWLSIFSFFAGWLTAELAVWHLIVAVPLAAGLAVGGADELPGQIGLGLTVFGLALVLLSLRHAHDAARAMHVALDDLVLAPSASPGRPSLFMPLVSGLRGPFVRERDLVYHQEGRLALKLDVYAPATPREGRRAPMLMQIHGGAWIVGSKREQGIPMVKHMAAHGWVCLNVDYRLSPRATFPDPVVDLKRAIVWAKAHAEELGADPEFIVLTGGSAGGHLSALVALTPNDPEYQPGFESEDTRVQGCVPFYGVYDFTSKTGIRRDAIARGLVERFIMKKRMQDALHDYERASPIRRAGADRPPFLVVHGTNDSLAVVEEARAFVERLRETSPAPAFYAEIPGAQHAFDVFASIRTEMVLVGVRRFLTWLYEEHERARTEARPALGRARLAEESRPEPSDQIAVNVVTNVEPPEDSRPARTMPLPGTKQSLSAK
ncbi:MAG: alpha/beta hydrolase [Polyangiaceae bacterium]